MPLGPRPAASEGDSCPADSYAIALHAMHCVTHGAIAPGVGFVEQRRGARRRKSPARIARHALRYGGCDRLGGGVIKQRRGARGGIQEAALHAMHCVTGGAFCLTTCHSPPNRDRLQCACVIRRRRDPCEDQARWMSSDSIEPSTYGPPQRQCGADCQSAAFRARLATASR